MTVYSTIWSESSWYNDRVTTLDWRELGTRGLLRSLLRTTRDDVVIINGALGFPARWRDLLGACTARLLRQGPRLVITDATWEPRSLPEESNARGLWRLNNILTRQMVRYLADERTVVCFLARREVDRFLGDLAPGVACAVFTPFFATLGGEEADALRRDVEDRTGPERYVFTGGNTLRNWGLLTDALADCGMKVRVATRHTERTWPANFVVGPIPPDHFFQVAAGATVGVVALRADIVRSAGQQTYLNLLRLGVPVVVNDAPGVRDHLEGIPGAVISPATDPHAMRAATLAFAHPERRAAVEAEVRLGREMVEGRFSEQRYLERIVSLAEGLA
jgi:hypothetical protein